MPVLACRAPPWHPDQVLRSLASALWLLLLGIYRLSSWTHYAMHVARAVNDLRSPWPLS